MSRSTARQTRRSRPVRSSKSAHAAELTAAAAIAPFTVVKGGRGSNRKPPAAARLAPNTAEMLNYLRLHRPYTAQMIDSLIARAYRRAGGVQ